MAETEVMEVADEKQRQGKKSKILKSPADPGSVGVRFGAELLEDLRKISESERRPVSELVRDICAQAVEDNPVRTFRALRNSLEEASISLEQFIEGEGDWWHERFPLFPFRTGRAEARKLQKQIDRLMRSFPKETEGEPERA